jgi:hypothetical protein
VAWNKVQVNGAHTGMVIIYRLFLLSLLLATPVLAASPAPRMQTLEILTPEQEKQLLSPRHKTTAPGQPATATTAAPETHHLDLTPAPTSPAKPEAAPAPSTPAPSPLVPLKDLKHWDQANALYTARANPNARTKLINAFNAQPGLAAPHHLLQLAVLVADTGDMKNAAKLYYGAQLRARFDYARWPLRNPNNPHQQFTADLREQGKDIATWAVASSARLAEVMESVRGWDTSTPYAYLPDWKLPPSPPGKPEAEWPDLLAQARTQFFSDADKVTDALRTMGR